MHLAMQAKILRVLQDREFTRVGGNKTLRVDVRVIAATNKNLLDAIDAANLRADLYDRLNVVTLDVPPLRERREDIPLIADFFLRKYSQEIRKTVTEFDEETKALIQNHSWPGNIRELKNLIERAVLVGEDGDLITPEDLAMSGKDYFAAGGRDRRKRSEDELISFDTLNLETVERETILKALQMSKWVQKGAASLLGVSPRALNYKINQHDITHPSWKKNH